MQVVRKLKVRRSFSVDVFPAVLLSGRWLERAGFRIGQTVEVMVRKGRLVIRIAE